MSKMISFPFDSYKVVDSSGNISYDRGIDSVQWREFLKAFVGNGVEINPSTALQVLENTTPDMSVIVGSGRIFVEGNIGYTENTRLMVFANADNQDRIDRVVVRRDLRNEARNMDLYIVKGTPAEVPTAPALTRNSDVYEMCLANVLISSGTTTITNEKITDTRKDNAVCGIIHALFEQLDTTTLNAQYESWLEATRLQGEQDLEESKQEFNTFVDNHILEINQVLATKEFSNINNVLVSSANWVQNGEVFEQIILVPNVTSTSNIQIGFLNESVTRAQLKELFEGFITPTPNNAQIKLTSDVAIEFDFQIVVSQFY